MWPYIITGIECLLLVWLVLALLWPSRDDVEEPVGLRRSGDRFVDLPGFPQPPHPPRPNDPS